MKKPSPLALVGLYFIQRAAPGFHGQVVAEAAGPFITADVMAWPTHKPVTVRVFNGDEIRTFDLYRTRAAWLEAVTEVDDVRKKQATA